jgi:hypothetical protein
LEEEGFLVIDRTENDFDQGAGIPGGRWSNGTQIPLDDPYLLVSRPGFSQIRLNFPGVLEIVYLREDVDPDYLTFNGISEESRASMLSLLEGPIVFSPEGNLIEEKKVAKTGYWSIEQISRRLPLNYIPH